MNIKIKTHTNLHPTTLSLTMSTIITVSSKTPHLLLWIIILILLISPFSNPLPQTIMLPTHPDSTSPSSNTTQCPAPDPTRNFRPIIGIVTHPGDGASGRLKNGSSVSYIAASYVKFVESAGALVVPLVYTEPRHVILKDNNILERYDASYMASSLQFVEDVSIKGTVFQRFPPDLLKKLSTDCLVMQNHKFGISPKTLEDNQHLSSFFRILTISADRDDKVYVSTAQAQHYPVTAFQWHPEKNAYEGGSTVIPHSEDAIQITQWVANYFIR
ncbi:hypothetical protein KSS87_002052 [Heliosperma pusillum]|nr:hypothetical protein KSS87_002052 [Heliosperma pusillum]